MVSVSIITYNHEGYIEAAIESVLDQLVNFPVEIIIGDDCSSDNTREIIRAYERKFPNLISAVYHPRRYKEIPGRVNNITNLLACRGKYIAMLDGDDYWISTNKLLEQLSFLENNCEYVLSFHDSKVGFMNSSKIRYTRSNTDLTELKEKQTFTHADVVKKWSMPTSSLVYRNIFSSHFPNWLWDVYSADYGILLFLSQFGFFYKVEDLYSFRRKTSSSFTKVYGKREEENRVRIREWGIFAREFPLMKSSGGYRLRRAHWQLRQASICLRRKALGSATRYFTLSLADDPLILLRRMKRALTAH